MTTTENTIYNNALASLGRQAGQRVTSAIRKASARTGVDFAYLMEQAAAESSFDAKAKSKTSSAAGLYQFIESTWLRMVKQHGHKYGLEAMADKISADGKVSDPQTRAEILGLRNDPEKAALLAAEFASDNRRYLERHTDASIGATELYLAHFLGAGGAAGFLNAMKENPLTAGADIFPKAALANRNVFYDPKSGAPRTLTQIHDFFARKFKGGDLRSSRQYAAATAERATTPLSMPPHKPRTGMPFTAASASHLRTDPVFLATALNPSLGALSSALSFDSAALSILAGHDSREGSERAPLRYGLLYNI